MQIGDRKKFNSLATDYMETITKDNMEKLA